MAIDEATQSGRIRDDDMEMSIPYEISEKPWFGPRKRATEFLVNRTTVLPPAEAVKVFPAIIGPAADHIRRVRFIDYIHRYEQPFRYTIALLWIGPHAIARDTMYDKAKQVVEATGWYLLPQGERMSSRIRERDFEKLRISYASKELGVTLSGKFRYIHSAVNQEGGCSIRVVTDDGSFLFDTGLPGALAVQPSDRVVLLSHGHLDHSGGTLGGTCDGVPTIMSTATARLLTATGRASSSWLKRHARLLDCGQETKMGGLVVRPFAVPHCPGSVGYTVRGDNASIVFSGDMAISSSRHNFAPTLAEIVSDHSQGQCIVLIDATMAGRDHGVSQTETAPALLSKFSEYEDIAIVSNDVEHLLYAYLDLFHTAKVGSDTRGQIEFIATPLLRSVFEVLHSAFITRQLDLLDPFLVSQYGKSMSAWAESRWLYWLGPDCQLEEGSRYRRLWFVTIAEIGLVMPRSKVGLVSVGRLTHDFSAVRPNWEKVGLDSAVWTLHSDEDTLSQSIRELSMHNASVLLFHNYEKRIKKFASRNRLTCAPLEDKPFPLPAAFMNSERQMSRDKENEKANELPNDLMQPIAQTAGSG